MSTAVMHKEEGGTSVRAECVSKEGENGPVPSGIPREEHELRISTQKLLWKLDTRFLLSNRVLRL
jgi:hypothetical protein